MMEKSAPIRFHGEAVDLEGVHQARALGISAVFQEFSLVPTLSVEENLFLGSELTHYGFLDKAELHRRAADILKQLGFPLRPGQGVRGLTRAQQQMVEIAKAFSTDLSVLILDEPTASLTDREAEHLFAMVEQAKSRGVGIIYITHRMSEIRRIGDRITVLRDGKRVVVIISGHLALVQLLWRTLVLSTIDIAPPIAKNAMRFYTKCAWCSSASTST